MSRIVPDRLKPLYDGAANLSDPWCLCFEPDEECVYVVMWNPEEEKWEKKEPITYIGSIWTPLGCSYYLQVRPS